MLVIVTRNNSAKHLPSGVATNVVEQPIMDVRLYMIRRVFQVKDKLMKFCFCIAYKNIVNLHPCPSGCVKTSHSGYVLTRIEWERLPILNVRYRNISRCAECLLKMNDIRFPDCIPWCNLSAITYWRFGLFVNNDMHLIDSNLSISRNRSLNH